jgi:hypothetical protein
MLWHMVAIGAAIRLLEFDNRNSLCLAANGNFMRSDAHLDKSKLRFDSLK